MKNGIRLVAVLFAVNFVVIMNASGGRSDVGVGLVIVLPTLLLGTLVYFIPSFVAHYNGNPQGPFPRRAFGAAA